MTTRTFGSLDHVEKLSYVLRSELWESKFDGLLSLVSECIEGVYYIEYLYKFQDTPSDRYMHLVRCVMVF